MRVRDGALPGATLSSVGVPAPPEGACGWGVSRASNATGPAAGRVAEEAAPAPPATLSPNRPSGPRETTRAPSAAGMCAGETWSWDTAGVSSADGTEPASVAEGETGTEAATELDESGPGAAPPGGCKSLCSAGCPGSREPAETHASATSCAHARRAAGLADAGTAEAGTARTGRLARPRSALGLPSEAGGAACRADGAGGTQGASDASDESPLFGANTLAGCGLRAGGGASGGAFSTGDCGCCVPARGSGMSGATHRASPVFAAAGPAGWPPVSRFWLARPESQSASRGFDCRAGTGPAGAATPSDGAAGWRAGLPADGEAVSAGLLGAGATAAPVAAPPGPAEHADSAAVPPAGTGSSVGAGFGRSWRVL
jgi:hypothetical protein